MTACTCRLNQALLGFLLLVGCAAFPGAEAVTPAGELAEARKWTDANFKGGRQTSLPFSFTFDGKPSAGLLKSWAVKRTARRIERVCRSQIGDTADCKSALRHSICDRMH